MTPGPSVQEMYDEIALELGSHHSDIVVGGQDGPGGFGSNASKVDGEIFAMILKGELVAKLPPRRVAELIELGAGQRFDPGRGRLMKEWLTLTPADLATCKRLMTEALAFVTSS